MWPARVMTRGAVSFWKARCVFHVGPTGVRMLCSNCWCFSKGKGSSLTCGETTRQGGSPLRAVSELETKFPFRSRDLGSLGAGPAPEAAQHPPDVPPRGCCAARSG